MERRVVVVVFMFTLIVTRRLLPILKSYFTRWFCSFVYYTYLQDAAWLLLLLFQCESALYIYICWETLFPNPQYTNHFSLNLARLKCISLTYKQPPHAITPNRNRIYILLNMNCYSVYKIVEWRHTNRKNCLPSWDHMLKPCVCTVHSVLYNGTLYYTLLPAVIFILQCIYNDTQHYV